MHQYKNLTWSSRRTSSSSSNRAKSMARWPVTSSRSIIPYPNTSVFSEDFPVDKYSGAIWPMVPRTWVVTWVNLVSTSFANPKSPRTASNLSSKRMFAAFKSRCMILGLQYSCRYSKPWAAPKAIRFRTGQSKPLSPGFKSRENFRIQ